MSEFKCPVCSTDLWHYFGSPEDAKQQEMLRFIEATTVTMEKLREDHWCVALQVIPEELSDIIEGSNKWSAEAFDWQRQAPHPLHTGLTNFRGNHSAFGDTPDEAITKLLASIDRTNPKEPNANL